MTTPADVSIGYAIESVAYKTPATPTRWNEFTGDTFDWNKDVKQGQGLRVGGRVARSGRRVVPTAQGGGDYNLEAASKGLGLLWQLCLGAGVSTLVSGSTQQQLFTLGDVPPSATMQKSSIRADGTVDAVTYLGCMVANWELGFPNGDIAALKATFDIGDFTRVPSFTPTSYAAQPVNLFHFAGGTISTGALTAPTTTVLGSAATPLAGVRGGSVQCNNNLITDRYNLGGVGRKDKPLAGLREIAGSMDVEYRDTSFRDAVFDETPMALVLTFTAGALSTGLETLQLVLPEVKVDGNLPPTNGTQLSVASINFSVLDNLTAAQPIWVVTRTADSAL